MAPREEIRALDEALKTLGVRELEMNAAFETYKELKHSICSLCAEIDKKYKLQVDCTEHSEYVREAILYRIRALKAQLYDEEHGGG